MSGNKTSAGRSAAIGVKAKPSPLVGLHTGLDVTYEEQGVRLLRVLTDRGTEYCGTRDHHEYELYLSIEEIEHTRTKARHPQTNGICERFHRTIQDEFYALAFRRKLYMSVDEIQADLDEWLKKYNEERPHSGRYCFGKTPLETFKDSKHLADEKMLDQLTVTEATTS